MPCFVKPRSATLEMSASSVGSTRSSASNSMHLGAEARVGRGDLGARRAGADDGERLRQLLERPRLLGADHAAAELACRGSACGTEPVARMIVLRGLVSPSSPTRDVAVAGRATPSPSMTSILFFLNRPRDAAGQRLDDLRAALADGAEVDRRGSATVMPNSSASSISDEDVGDAQHRLGGDAGVVQAAPADRVLLDHRGLHAELGGADRGDVAARPGADDDAVVGALGHGGG